MLTKLRSNPGVYDVVLGNSAFTAQAQSEGLLAAIDTSKIPNFKDVDPNLAKNQDLNPASAFYGVPCTWAPTSFAVNTGDMAPPPTSVQMFSDPNWKGRGSIRDDALKAVQFASLATGQNINDIRDLDGVKTKLTAPMPQIKTCWGSENDCNQIVSAGDLALATYWSGSNCGRSLRVCRLPLSCRIKGHCPG